MGVGAVDGDCWIVFARPGIVDEVTPSDVRGIDEELGTGGGVRAVAGVVDLSLVDTGANRHSMLCFLQLPHGGGASSH